MNFRALLTRKENDEPISEEVNVCIYDANDNKIYDKNLKTSEYGILGDSFKLDNEINSGIYRLVLKTNSRQVTELFEVRNDFGEQNDSTDKTTNIALKTNKSNETTDKFKVELIAEEYHLIAGKTNEVYIFTSNLDGSPLKTNITIISENFQKQIVTDEKGIGKFEIDVESIPSGVYGDINKTFTIIARNANLEEVKEIRTLDVWRPHLVANTDKNKYEQGETIKINIESPSEDEKIIYIFKNYKMLKTISTDLSEIEVNLGDEYGLIDICVAQYNKTPDKKIIFIKPEKKLNIEIATDKKEYEPEEKIAASFTTTDENNNLVDSALLVSVVDDTFLDLVKKEISIDNIKMALSGLTISNKIDVATLYSCIIDEQSEQVMTALLLKANDTGANLYNTEISNYEEEQRAANVSVILIIIIVCIVVIYFITKRHKLTKSEVIKHIMNGSIYTFAMVELVRIILAEIYGGLIYFYEELFLFLTLMAIVTYIYGASKLIDKMFITTSMILITYTLNYFGIFGILFSLTMIIIKIKKSQVDKKVISSGFDFILKYILALIIAVIVGAFVEKITAHSDTSIIVISIICVYGLNYLFNKEYINNLLVVERKYENRAFGFYITIILSLVIICSAIKIFGNKSYRALNELMPGIKSEKKIDKEIRKVFLESMCFVPELVTSEGKAQLNIETDGKTGMWTIHVVENTKDGRIGYGMVDSIEVTGNEIENDVEK